MKVVNTDKEIIENKLLVTLDDKSKVAILASEDDLDKLIRGLKLLEVRGSDLFKGLVTLRKAAFSA